MLNFRGAILMDYVPRKFWTKSRRRRRKGRRKREENKRLRENDKERYL